ncbi:flagellar protein FlgN [Sediminibacillus albus]|uniref:FlgN protein n=1 Tax=Sediminibacillus albus TaxID=407036 RepID=A0A1G8YM98_9BACI|nr:flagellar protein FlgN [Sediminibacillus albus]SDK03863.1 FlgN protein [Sediminibacillus albus]
MSVQPIVESLESITKLHESLLSLSIEKTECLKAGDTEKLQALLLKERKHVQAINQMEEKRQQIVQIWSESNNVPTDKATVTGMLERMEDPQDKLDLESHFLKLTNVLVELKQQEKLNQELTKQSLQFIEISIDMMDPSLKNMNYGNTSQAKSQQTNKRSLFDSKA